jgi:hypothetical protein
MFGKAYVDLLLVRSHFLFGADATKTAMDVLFVPVDAAAADD